MNDALASQKSVEAETWRDAAIRHEAECVRLRAIVNDLADSHPYGRGNYCALCGERYTAISHTESCAYRRAVEYKEGQP